MDTNQAFDRRQWRGKSEQERAAAFKNIWIPAPHHARVLSRIEDKLDYVSVTDDCEGMLVICNSGGGKTSLLRELRRRYPDEQHEERTMRRVAIMRIPRVVTRAALAKELLRAIGDPAHEVGNAEKNLERAIELMHAAGLKVLAVDNFQDIPERRSTGSVRVVGNWFRDLIDAAAIVLLALGTEQAKKVRFANDQVRRRVTAVMHIPYFAVEDPLDLRAWVQLLRDFDACMPLAESSGLAEPRIAARLFLGSNGIFGYLGKLLRRAMVNAVRRGAERIDLKDLEYAFPFIAGDIAARGNPFTPDFEARPLTGVDELFYRLERFNEGGESTDDEDDASTQDRPTRH